MTEEKVKVYGEYGLPEDEIYFDKETKKVFGEYALAEDEVYFDKTVEEMKQTDEPCVWCEERSRIDWWNYCPWCGRKL